MRRTLSANTTPHDLGIFVHIPKTGGLTVYWILTRQYIPEAIFTLDWSKHFDDAVRDFAALPDVQKQRVKIVRGHMRFALRTAFPANACYFTILRNPVERIISYYAYVRRSAHHPWYRELHARNMTLYDFVTQVPDWNLDNCQTRFLADEPSWVEFGKCTADMAASAKKNLKKFAVLGLTERFDETLILLKRIFQWNYPVYFKQNVSQKRLAAETMTNDALQAIKDRNALDIELYRHARALTEQRLRQQPANFRRDLALFKIVNSGFQRCHSLYFSLKMKVQAFTVHHKDTIA